MKEKILYTLLLFSILNHFSTAQSYTPFDFPNSLWEEEYYNMQYHRSYYNYFTDGDTIINSLVYQKLYKAGRYTLSYNASPQFVSWFSFSDLTGFIREDNNKRVYYRAVINSGIETLLYDFNCSLGDTIAIPPINSIYGNAEVVSIDTISVCSTMRKRYELAPIGTILIHPLYWIEGIGGTHGLIPDYNWFEDGARHVCFSDGNCPNCPLILTNYNIATQAPRQATLYPNPTSENSYIQLNNKAKSTSVQVLNSLGQVVFKKTITNQKEMIQSDQWPIGIYSVRLEYENHKEVHYLIKQ